MVLVANFTIIPHDVTSHAYYTLPLEPFFLSKNEQTLNNVKQLSLVLIKMNKIEKEVEVRLLDC